MKNEEPLDYPIHLKRCWLKRATKILVVEWTSQSGKVISEIESIPEFSVTITALKAWEGWASHERRYHLLAEALDFLDHAFRSCLSRVSLEHQIKSRHAVVNG